MGRLLRCSRARGSAHAAARPLVPFLLAVSLGCQAPPAHFPSSTGDRSPAPAAVLARQVAADTAVAVACHPFRSGFQVGTEPAGQMWHLGLGALGKRLLMPWHRTPTPLLLDCPDPAPEGEGLPLAGTDLLPARLQLYPDGAAALEVLQGLIGQAAERIDVLMFQWESDALGQALADQLAARAASGVTVRILVDGGGNLFFGHPDHRAGGDVNRVVEGLSRKANVEVLRTRDAFARFDHRKLVLVDGRVAWTGGRNFTRKAFFGQHDLSFTLEGPLVDELVGLFEQFWEDQGGAPALGGKGPRAELADALPPNAWARVLETAPLHHGIQRALYAAVDTASRYVYLENFTCCDGRLMYKLAKARRRGADVRVVLTLSAHPDVINRTNRVTINRLLHAGVRIYLYPDMTHVKAAAVDGRWAYVGTGNFDPLSFRHNRELGLAIADGPAIAELEERLFRADFRPEWEQTTPLPLTVGDWLCELASSIWL